MATDMSLGGGAGFGAGYTPIQFAPLMSLTGPVMAPATPAAPEAAAPMAPALRLPQMSDMPDNAYMTGEIPAYGGASIGNRSGAEIRGDLARIGEFFINPLSTMASYAATGKMPSEHIQGMIGGTGSNPFAGFLQGLQGFFGGGQQAAEVPLGGSQAGLSSQGLGMGSAAFNDALSMGESMGLAPEFSQQAASAAATMVAQGVDPATALAMALMDASMAASQGSAGMPAPGGQVQGLPGLSRNEFDMTTPVAPQTAQTFGLGQPSQIESSTQMGGLGGAESPFGGFTGGGWSAGDVAGAYSDSTGFE